MRLLDSKSCPYSSRCRMVVYAKNNSAVELFEAPGGIGSDAYKALHPFVKIPMLDLGDERKLLESDPICEYLDDVLGAPSLKPDDPFARAYMRMLGRTADTVISSITSLFTQLNPDSRDTDLVARYVAELMTGFDKLEYYLSGTPYTVGETLSLADCALVPALVFTLNYLPRFDVSSPLHSRPKLQSYWDGIVTDPVATRVIKEMQDKFAEYRTKASA